MSLLEEYNEWMTDPIGINVKGTRLENTLSLLRIIVDHYRQNKVLELMQKYDEATLFYVLTDTITFIELFAFFKNKKSHEIPRGKLMQSINGPILPWKEEPEKGTAHSRNTSFELETAVWFHKSGLEIKNFDDVQFLFDNHTFNVQCKRIHSFKKISDNVESAVTQISKRMEVSSKMKGIICLCIDKLAEKEGWVLQVNNENEIGPHLDKLTHDFIRSYRHLWQKLVNINILGTAIVINTLASIKQDTYPMLTTCKHTMVDIIPNKAFQQEYDYLLIKRLGTKLEATRTMKT